MPQDEKKDAPAAPALEKAKKRGRPKGSKNKPKVAGAKKGAGRRGRPKSVEKAVDEAYKSGIHRYSDIAKSVKKATGQPISFSGIAKILKGGSGQPSLHRGLHTKAAATPKKGKRGPGRPKGKRGPGRPKGSGRRGRPSMATAGAAGFLIVQGRKIAKAASVADVKARLARILAKTDSLEGVEVYERRKVKIERTVAISL